MFETSSGNLRAFFVPTATDDIVIIKEDVIENPLNIEQVTRAPAEESALPEQLKPVR